MQRFIVMVSIMSEYNRRWCLRLRLTIFEDCNAVLAWWSGCFVVGQVFEDGSFRRYDGWPANWLRIACILSLFVRIWRRRCHDHGQKIRMKFE